MVSVESTKAVRSVFDMKYLLLLPLVVATCEAGVISTNIDHLPNIHAVYHGHGATSYQNVQIDKHDNIIVPANYGDPEEIQDLEHAFHEPIIPIVESHNDLDHIDISHSAPYEGFSVADVKSDAIEHYFDDDKHNYDFHLRK